MKEYSVTMVPTTIIDGSIKVVGIPDFPWICREDVSEAKERISVQEKFSSFILYSAQQESLLTSCLNDVATSFIASDIVGNTWTVSMMSSTVSLYFTAITAS